MECKNCGAIVPDGLLICNQCGAHVFNAPTFVPLEKGAENESGNITTANAVKKGHVKSDVQKKTNNAGSIVFLVLGMLLSVVIIYSGVKLLGVSFHGESLSRITFGGDYYTEQYAATKAAVSDLNSLGALIVESLNILGIFNIGFGGTLFSYFGYKACKK